MLQIVGVESDSAKPFYGHLRTGEQIAQACDVAFPLISANVRASRVLHGTGVTSRPYHRVKG